MEIADVEYSAEMDVRLVRHVGDDNTFADAARVSTGATSEGKDNTRLINTLIKQQHGTPFEHCLMTFYIDAPIFVWREFHRHRVGWSFNEESGRYKVMRPKFWMPMPNRQMKPVENWKPMRPKFESVSHDAYQNFILAQRRVYLEAWQAYNDAIHSGIALEVARSMLPVALYSRCWASCNARSLMHFLSLRVHRPEAKVVSYPQYEIQQVALAMEGHFKSLFPITYQAFIDNNKNFSPADKQAS